LDRAAAVRPLCDRSTSAIMREVTRELTAPPIRHGWTMATFVFRCPSTGLKVQGWSAEEIPDEPNTYETITCTACGQLHLVNPSTGRALGDPREDK